MSAQCHRLQTPCLPLLAKQQLVRVVGRACPSRLTVDMASSAFKAYKYSSARRAFLPLHGEYLAHITVSTRPTSTLRIPPYFAFKRVGF